MRLEVMKRSPSAWLRHGPMSRNRPSGHCSDFFVVPGDDVGGRLRKQIGRRFADDGVVRQPELSLGHPVGQYVVAVAHVLHGNLRRNVVDDLTQESGVAVAFVFEVPLLRNIFDRRDPSALCHGVVDDLKRPSIRTLHDGMRDFTLCDVAHDRGAEFLDIAIERSRLFAMPDQVEKVAARLYDIRRQLVHVEIALVAQDDACLCVIQHEPLRHVVQGGVEPVFLQFQPPLCFLILPGHLPDDQEQNEGDHEGGQDGGRDQEFGLRAPVGQHRRDGRGRDHHDRKAAERRSRTEPILFVDGALHPHRVLATFGQHLVQQRSIPEFFPDHRIGAGIACQHRSIAMEQGYRGIVAERQRCEQPLIVGWIDLPRHHAEKNTALPGQPMRNDGGPAPRISSCEAPQPGTSLTEDLP